MLYFPYNFMTLCLKSLAREDYLLDTDYSYKILTGFPSEECSLTRYFFIIAKLELIGTLIFLYAATLTTCAYSWFTFWPWTFSPSLGWKRKQAICATWFTFLSNLQYSLFVQHRATESCRVPGPAPGPGRGYSAEGNLCVALLMVLLLTLGAECHNLLYFKNK